MGKRNRKSKRIKSSLIDNSTPSRRILELPEGVDYNKKHPIFSLEYLQNGFDLEACTKDQKASLADALRKYSQMTWADIISSHRHKGGQEKIARNSIKAPIPNDITEDIQDFIALRFCGKRPMVGYRVNDIFYIVWLDTNFKLYDHG